MPRSALASYTRFRDLRCVQCWQKVQHHRRAAPRERKRGGQRLDVARLVDWHVEEVGAQARNERQHPAHGIGGRFEHTVALEHTRADELDPLPTTHRRARPRRRGVGVRSDGVGS